LHFSFETTLKTTTNYYTAWPKEVSHYQTVAN